MDLPDKGRRVKCTLVKQALNDAAENQIPLDAGWRIPKALRPTRMLEELHVVETLLRLDARISCFMQELVCNRIEYAKEPAN